MKGIKLHKKFQISSCDKRSAERKPQMAATLGAGVQDGELFSILSRLNATAVGGTNMVCIILMFCIGSHYPGSDADLVTRRTLELLDGPLAEVMDT
jgi:hypothetical protein